MISIDPFHIAGIDLNVSSVVAMEQHWRDGDASAYRDAGRPDHGLCYLQSGEILYTDANGHQRSALSGDVFYLPKGKRYRAEFSGDVNCTLINFVLTDNMGRALTLGDDIVCIATDLTEDIKALFERIPECYRGGGGIMELKSLVYSLMSKLFARMPEKGESNMIGRCVSYIESHYAEIRDITALAAMCGYGETAFRKHFREQMGVSPIHYINTVKIDRACDMLRSSEMTVAAVGEFLGFYDVAYFHKVFKRYVGMTPGEYIRTQREGQ